jgi:hypothetical protein
MSTAMNHPLNSVPKQQHAELQALQVIGKFLDLLADPQASRERLKELRDAATENQTLLATIHSESKALDDKRIEHTAALATEREVHDAKLREQRAAFDAECTRRSTALHDAEQRAEAAHVAANTARQHAVTLSNDLESRLAAIHGAATAPLPARH